MMTSSSRLSVVILSSLLVIGSAIAADQTILGKQEQVKDPTLGADLFKRKLVGQGKELASTNTVVGDFTVDGATVTFVATGTTSTNQTFALPGVGWIAKKGGFKYSDKGGAYGPVVSAEIAKSGKGTFGIKVTVNGQWGPINVVPPNTGTEACMLLDVAGGDRYHVLLGAGSTIAKDDAKGFVVKNATSEGLCVVPVPNCVATSGTLCDRGDGTIFDSSTNLQWEKKDGDDGTVDAANLHDVDNNYIWAGCCDGDCNGDHCQPNAAAEAACRAQTPSDRWAFDGCNRCSSGTCDTDPFGDGAITTVWDWVTQMNAANFAGHNDWRLPSEDGCNICEGGGPYGQCCAPAELESIVADVAGCGNPTYGPCIDPIFGPTATDYTFSGSSALFAEPPGDVPVAWGVPFFEYLFGIEPLYKDDTRPVRAVR